MKRIVDDDGSWLLCGLVRDITGYSARGLLYQADLLTQFPFGNPIQAPIRLTGALTNAMKGQFALTLDASATTNLIAQDRHDAHARYMLRAIVPDPFGQETTVGIMPVFVL